MYNKHLSQSYIADVCMEPIFTIVDSHYFSKFLGPVIKHFNYNTNRL